MISPLVYRSNIRVRRGALTDQLDADVNVIACHQFAARLMVDQPMGDYRDTPAISKQSESGIIAFGQVPSRQAKRWLYPDGIRSSR